jgi:hypothetical protein
MHKKKGLAEIQAIEVVFCSIAYHPLSRPAVRIREAPELTHTPPARMNGRESGGDAASPSWRLAAKTAKILQAQSLFPSLHRRVRKAKAGRSLPNTGPGTRTPRPVESNYSRQIGDLLSELGALKPHSPAREQQQGCLEGIRTLWQLWIDVKRGSRIPRTLKAVCLPRGQSTPSYNGTNIRST